MAVVSAGAYQAIWRPSGNTTSAGSGTIIIRNADNGSDLHRIENLGAQDFQIVLGMLQYEKPVFWDTVARHFRTSHTQSGGAEPVGEQEGA